MWQPALYTRDMRLIVQQIWRSFTAAAFYPVRFISRVGLWAPLTVGIASYVFLRSYWPVPVGVGIGILGFVAVFMTLRGEHAKQIEQTLWIVIVFALLIVEIAAIYADRDRHD